MKAVILFMLFCCLLSAFPAAAQEENAVAVQQGTKYLDFKINALDKLNNRVEQQQKKLLNKLKKQEKRFASKLKKTDSLAYARYKQQTLTYDSISKLSKADSSTIAAKTLNKKNALTDSLKGVESFIQSKSATVTAGNPQLSATLTTSNPQLQQNNAQITQLQGQLNYRDYINQLITQRTNSLQNLSSDGSSVPGLTGIEKQVYYGKSKMSYYKQVEEDPTVLESKALEYLQGTEGFSQSMSGATQGGAGSMQSLGSNVSAAQLQQMGFQTNSMTQSSLTQKFGGNTSGIAAKMSSQLSAFQSQANSITTAISNAKQAKASLKGLKNTDKPSFKVNPMRGLPLFWKRIQKQYTWQTAPATADGLTPALLNLSAMAGYKQSPSLTYGLGLIASFGLGEGWTAIHPSFQGAGYQSYINWTWQYGIGIYAGYERIYKEAVFTNTTESTTPAITATPHNNGVYTESVLVGLTKTYKISAQWSGQLQVLYDIYWQQEGLNSPVVVRFATISN